MQPVNNTLHELGRAAIVPEDTIIDRFVIKREDIPCPIVIQVVNEEISITNRICRACHPVMAHDQTSRSCGCYLLLVEGCHVNRGHITAPGLHNGVLVTRTTHNLKIKTPLSGPHINTVHAPHTNRNRGRRSRLNWDRRGGGSTVQPPRKAGIRVRPRHPVNRTGITTRTGKGLNTLPRVLTGNAVNRTDIAITPNNSLNTPPGINPQIPINRTGITTTLSNTLQKLAILNAHTRSARTRGGLAGTGSRKTWRGRSNIRELLAVEIKTPTCIPSGAVVGHRDNPDPIPNFFIHSARTRHEHTSTTTGKIRTHVPITTIKPPVKSTRHSFGVITAKDEALSFTLRRRPHLRTIRKGTANPPHKSRAPASPRSPRLTTNVLRGVCQRPSVRLGNCVRHDYISILAPR